jgi:hypothetical protein
VTSIGVRIYSYNFLLQIAVFSSIVAGFLIVLVADKTLGDGRNRQMDARKGRIILALFLSLFFSLSSAALCVHIQHACHEYLKFAYPTRRMLPQESGHVRTFLFQGLDIRRRIFIAHALLHISLILFFVALSEYFHTIHHHLGVVTRYISIASATIYVLFSTSPLLFSDSLSNTPLTPLLRTTVNLFRIIIRSPLLWLQWYHGRPLDLTGLPYYRGIRFDRARLYAIKAEEQAEKLQSYAMEWLFKENILSSVKPAVGLLALLPEGGRCAVRGIPRHAI